MVQSIITNISLLIIKMTWQYWQNQKNYNKSYRTSRSFRATNKSNICKKLILLYGARNIVENLTVKMIKENY